MKRFFLLLIVFTTVSTINAQIHEIGVFAGGSNFIGDVGSESYIKPNEFAYGFIYKWNRNPRYAWRFSYSQSKITGQDERSSDNRRQVRGFKFQNNIKEVALGFEFNFMDFNLHDFAPKITPYVVASVSYVHYEGLYFANNVSKIDNSNGTIGIPMIVGVKHNIAPQWILAAEVGVRYTFADDLDGSNPRNEDFNNARFGNINSNDWFVFSGLTLTYTFGNKPCYCPD